jgi:hypothetical protein
VYLFIAAMSFAQIPNNGLASPVPEVDQYVNLSLSHATVYFTSWRLQLHHAKPDVEITFKLLHVYLPSLQNGCFVNWVYEAQL